MATSTRPNHLARAHFQFDQQDLMRVQQSAKYLTREQATFEKADWNDDGVFDQLDTVAALQRSNYLQEPYLD